MRYAVTATLYATTTIYVEAFDPIDAVEEAATLIDVESFDLDQAHIEVTGAVTVPMQHDNPF